MKWTRDTFTVTTDPAMIDHDVVAGFLRETYWAKGVPAAVVTRSIEASLCFALRDATRQIGFARVVSDKVTIAYLGDVFVLPEFRGKGLGTWLMECVMSHSDLQGLRAWILVTRDAHELYKKFGFHPLGRPEGYMELRNVDAYRVVQQTHAPTRDT